MDPDEFLGPDPLVIKLTGKDPETVIDELIHHLVANHRIKAADEEAIAFSVKKRESAMSTGIGYGIALPHASTDSGIEVVKIVGCSREGIPFAALDGKPVNIVILFLVPTGQFQRHTETLADVAKLLHDRGFREGLRRRFL